MSDAAQQTVKRGAKPRPVLSPPRVMGLPRAVLRAFGISSPVGLAVMLLGSFLFGCRALAPSPPLGEQTALVFEGARSLPVDQLRAAVREDRLDPVEGPASRTIVDDAAYAIEELYRQRGFPDVEVAYDLVDAPPPVPGPASLELAGDESAESDAGGDPVATAIFRIEEGPRIVLGDVRFAGTPSIELDILERFFRPDPDVELPFVKNRLSSAASGIEAYYYQRGWLKTRVRDVQDEILRDEGLAHVTATIEEGPRFLLRGATLSLEAELPPEIDAALRRSFEGELAKVVEEPFVPPVSYGLRASLLETCGRLGYPEAEVALENALDQQTGDVRVALTLAPGPRVTIADVRLEGRQDARRHLLRNRLLLGEDDLYDAAAVRESFANLYRSGLFRSVQIELEDPGDPPTADGGALRDLVVTVEELPSLELFFEPGYGSYEGPRLTIGADERNLFSTGTGLRAEATVGALAQGATLAWNDPWIDRGRFEARIALTANHREEPSFTQTEFGTEWSLARVWSEILRSTVFYRFRRNELDDVDFDTGGDLLEEALDDVNVASLGISTTLDDRDALFTPRRGGRKRASLEWASEGLGGEINFLAANLEASHFFALSDRTVLAMRVRTGVKAPIAGTVTLPVQERYFNGGENTVRAFREDQLGPQDSGDEPIGGETFSIANLELRRDLAGSLGACLFYDFGNVSSDVDDYFDFDELRGGPGLGLNYLLPIGPVRLDVAWNPDARGDEDDVVVHLAIGMAF